MLPCSSILYCIRMLKYITVNYSGHCSALVLYSTARYTTLYTAERYYIVWYAQYYYSVLYHHAVRLYISVY